MKYVIFAFFHISKLILYPYGMIMYPLAFVLRKFIRLNKVTKYALFPLWIVLDDEEDFGEPFFMIGRKRNFLTSYLWAAIRNNCWNYHSLFRKRVASPEIFPTKRLKWEYKEQMPGGYKWVSGWTVNQGDRLSERYSTLGWDNREIECIDVHGKDVKLWTISYAGKWRWFLLNLKLGYNDLGEMIIEFKVKPYKKYYTEHWTQPLH